MTDQRSVGAAFDQAGPTGEFLDRSGRIAYFEHLLSDLDADERAGLDAALLKIARRVEA